VRRLEERAAAFRRMFRPLDQTSTFAAFATMSKRS
jgi:hypothetical protein